MRTSGRVGRRIWWYLLAGAVLAAGMMLAMRGWRGPETTPPFSAAGPEQFGLPDWPHLRGPNYNAVSTETGLADAWPAEGPPVLWMCELGQGYSGFVVAAGRAYTQAQTLAGQVAVCLDAATGAETWRYRYGWPWQPAGRYPGPYATPTIRAGKLYFAAPDGLVGCLDAATGRSLWEVNVLRRFKGQGAGFGYACTPLAEDGKVILPVGGPGASLVALDAIDGSTVWQSGDDHGSYTPALPITIEGRRWVVAFLRNALVALDLNTGAPRLREEVSTHYDEHAAWPLYAEPYLVVSAPFRVGAQCFRLEPAAPKPARPCWASRELSNDVCSSVLVNGFVYGFDLQELQANAHRASRGRFRCLELATGRVCWSSDRIGQASVVAADGKLILLDDTGTLVLARCTPDGYEELGRARVLGGLPCWTPPALCRGRLYVRDQERAVCLYLGDPGGLSPEQRQPATALQPKSRRWDWSVVTGTEPDYPNDLPTWEEFGLWYGACLACFGIAALAAGATALRARPAAPVVFWGLVWLLGLGGTTAAGYLAQRFVLTWPAALFAAYQVTLTVIHWAEQKPLPQRRQARRWSRLVGLAFLAMCLGYYELCKRVALATGWIFLVGFLPAWPVAVRAARGRQRPAWQTGLWVGLAFTIYYWGSALFLVCKAGLEG